MATFFLDLEGGNDTLDGTTFANRWKTWLSGATAARIAPGDVIRVMGSKAPTSMGQNVTWTNGSANLALASAVTQLIDDCEAAWSASTNVTCATSTARKSGSNSASISFASAFTTGKAAFKATASTLDLSAYQQLTFWVQTNGAIAASTLSLRLCSDTAGATTVNTIALPAIPAANVWHPVTVDTGGALGSSIQSIALYADLDPGTPTVLLDNISAAKASSSADSLTLNSLIGKPHVLNWQATTGYSLNDVRIPTTPNRTGLCYKVTTAGTSSSGEPSWPDVIGGTVTDGSVVWTALEASDTWYPIAAINGTTVTLSSLGTGATPATYKGYGGATETVAGYKREPIVATYGNTTNGIENTINDNGSSAGLITYSGGWNRTDMSTQDGETWVTYGNWRGGTSAQAGANGVNIAIEYFSTVRALNGFFPQTGSGTAGLWKFTGCAAHDSNGSGITSSSNQGDVVLKDCKFWGNPTDNITLSGNTRWDVRRCLLDGGGTGVAAPSSGAAVVRLEECLLRRNSWGIWISGSAFGATITAFSCKLSGHSSADIHDPSFNVKLHNCDLASTTDIDTSVAAQGPLSGSFTYVGKNDQTANNHKAQGYGVTVVSDSTTVHTAGISWKFTVTNTLHHQFWPVIFPIAQIAVKAGVTKNVSIYCRRDNTNIQGKLRIRGGQLNGVPEQSVSLAPSINTWTQSGSISVTPTEDGVLEVEVLAWDGVGTANNLWVDDLTVT